MTGCVVGQADDEILIMADSIDEAMEKLLGYSDTQWPDAGGEYSAVCWLEVDGEVVSTEDVIINVDGTRQ